MFNFRFKFILGFFIVFFSIESTHVGAETLPASDLDQTRWIFEGEDCKNRSINNPEVEFLKFRRRLSALGTWHNLTYSRKGIFGAHGLDFIENNYFEVSNRKFSFTEAFFSANRGTIIKGNFDKYPVGCVTFTSAETNSRTKGLFRVDRTFAAENQKRRREEMARKNAETETLLTIAIKDFVEAYKFLVKAEQEVKKGGELSAAARELALEISQKDYLK